MVPRIEGRGQGRGKGQQQLGVDRVVAGLLAGLGQHRLDPAGQDVAAGLDGAQEFGW